MELFPNAGNAIATGTNNALRQIQAQDFVDQRNSQNEIKKQFAEAGGDDEKIANVLRSQGKLVEAEKYLKLVKERKKGESGNQLKELKDFQEALTLIPSITDSVVKAPGIYPVVRTKLLAVDPELSNVLPEQYDDKTQNVLDAIAIHSEDQINVLTGKDAENAGFRSGSVVKQTQRNGRTVDFSVLQNPEKPKLLTKEEEEQQIRIAERKAKAGKPDPTNVNVNVDTTEESFAKEFGKQNASQFFERRKSAQDAAASLQGNAEARKLLDSGVITGTGAEFITGLGKALQRAGFNVAVDEIANTEAFVASQAKQIANIIKAFGSGSGLSDADREFAEKAAGGKITMTEESIRRILDINDRASKNVIDLFNADAKKIDPELSPFPLTVGRDIQNNNAQTEQATQPIPAQQNIQESKVINGLTYIKINGKWFHQ